MKVTSTNGNGSNGIRGSRITIRANDGVVIDRFIVPSMYGGVNYCKRYPTGKYGKRFYEGLRKCSEYEKQNSSNQTCAE